MVMGAVCRREPLETFSRETLSRDHLRPLNFHAWEDWQIPLPLLAQLARFIVSPPLSIREGQEYVSFTA